MTRNDLADTILTVELTIGDLDEIRSALAQYRLNNVIADSNSTRSAQTHKLASRNGSLTRLTTRLTQLAQAAKQTPKQTPTVTRTVDQSQQLDYDPTDKSHPKYDTEADPTHPDYIDLSVFDR